MEEETENETENEADHAIDHSSQRQLVFRPNLGCGICFERVVDPSLAGPMPCCHYVHIVHHRCAVHWYLHQRQRGLPPSCPFCRSEVLSIPQFDALYTFSSPTTKLDAQPQGIFADADAPLPYYTGPANLVHLTHISYTLMICNLIFVCWIACMLLR